MEQAYLCRVSEVLEHFHVTEAAGLSPVQVAEARKRYGSNCEPSLKTSSLEKDHQN